MRDNYSLVTTSWDDGDPLDLRLAELLAARELPATFYVPLNYRNRPRLTHCEMRELADQNFEIGAHGMRHRDLRTLDDLELGFELSGAKTILEQTLGRDVHTLCYPCGRYDSRVIQQARLAGYRGARTTRMLSWSAHFSDFEMPVTMQALPHKWSSYCRNLLKRGSTGDLVRYFRRFISASWVEIAKATFDLVGSIGGIWHLYGHSWEIERHAQWKQLTEVLDYVSHRPGILYLTNREVIEYASKSTVSAEVA
jgi:peptidoglycan/xylan/chitin deacetylase (PgdA/CDA1 family)